MKKLLLMAMCVLTFALAGCGEKEDKVDNETKTNSIEEGNTSSEASHEHVFSEATCTEAATCAECGATDGEPLGHTVNIGKCSRCNEIAGEEIVIEISKNMQSANDYFTKANEIIKSANTSDLNDCYNKFNKAAEQYAEAKEYLIKARDLCGDYEELSGIKSDINAAIAKIPGKTGSSREELISFLEENQEFCISVANAFRNLANMLESLAN